MKCSQCEAEEDKDASLVWYAIPWFFIFGMYSTTRPLCRDCIGGQNFLALLAWAAVLVVAFVVAVIVL